MRALFDRRSSEDEGRQSKEPEHFILDVRGEIVSAQFPGSRQLQCDFSYVYDDEHWEVNTTTGESVTLREGTTQTSVRSWGKVPSYVWNFPLDITFRSTSAFGWPKLCLWVSDSGGGRSSCPVVGYGWTHIPTSPGTHEMYVPLFKPKATSVIQKVLSLVQKEPIEFFNPELICGDEGRKVTRVQYSGKVKVKFIISLKDFQF